MKQIFLLLFGFLSSINLFSQVDSIFLIHKNKLQDSKKYITDTVVLSNYFSGHFLIGTTALPNTENQIKSMPFGLILENVTKSDCQNNGEEVYYSEDKINSIITTDSSIIIEINIYKNCCYDFLCDYLVDSVGNLNLIYYGYGELCGCDCCFGLTYHFSIDHVFIQTKKVKSVILNGNKKTLKLLK